MPEIKRIGIVGCGAIGGQLAHFIDSNFKDRARLTAVCDYFTEKAQALSKELNPHPEVLPLESIPSHCDLLVEAANQETCRKLVPMALEKGCDIMTMSIGGLIDIYEKVFALARSKNANLYIPSGAIAGIDGLEAAMLGGVTSVKITTRKPMAALADAPYVVEKGLRFAEFTGDTVIFDGSARDAVKAFPLNINVAATLSFAGLGFDRTKVQVVTGPGITTNTHEIEIEGAFGRLTTRTENVPSPENPKTSYLAVLSACAMLNSILNPVKIGT